MHINIDQQSPWLVSPCKSPISLMIPLTVRFFGTCDPWDVLPRVVPAARQLQHLRKVDGGLFSDAPQWPMETSTAPVLPSRRRETPFRQVAKGMKHHDFCQARNSKKEFQLYHLYLNLGFGGMVDDPFKGLRCFGARKLIWTVIAQFLERKAVPV